MANICNNEIYVVTEDKDNYNYLLENIEYKLQGYIYYINEGNENTSMEFEGSFESRWTFPEEKLEDLINNLPNKKDSSLYIKIFSREDGCYYCEYHIYEIEKGWEIH